MDSKARDALDELLWCLKRTMYEHAEKYVQLTFKASYNKSELKNWIEGCIPFRLVEYEIVERHMRTDDVDENVFRTYKVKVKDSRGREYICLPNVICEKRPYKVSKSGVWGVNLISLIPKDLKPKNKLVKVDE